MLFLVSLPMSFLDYLNLVSLKYKNLIDLRYQQAKLPSEETKRLTPEPFSVVEFNDENENMFYFSKVEIKCELNDSYNCTKIESLLIYFNIIYYNSFCCKTLRILI